MKSTNSIIMTEKIKSVIDTRFHTDQLAAFLISEMSNLPYLGSDFCTYSPSSHLLPSRPYSETGKIWAALFLHQLLIGEL